MKAISAERVCVDVGGHRIVDSATFDVGPGEWLSVIGPNGAGKTTLLRAVAGLVRASGDLRLCGAPVATLSPRERARRVALVPQSPVLPAGMSVFDYVMLGRTAHIAPLATERRADYDATRDALAALSLDGLVRRDIDTLSGGECQRAVIARAIAQSAPVLLLDEPTTSLDIGHQQDVLELIDRLRRERDLAVLSTMHDLDLAAQFADRLLLLAGGRCVASGAAADVLTEENIERHYGARVRVQYIDGELHVVTRSRTRADC